MKLRTFQTTEELIFKCLEVLKQTLPSLGPNDGIMLSGGRTPLEIYRRAAAEQLSTQGKFFLSDERYVPVTDPQSNYGVIFPFFSNLEKIRTELPIEQAAQEFHEYLNRVQSVPLGLLGLGADGHTASLFNLNDASLCDERLAIPITKIEKPSRISVTPTLLHKVEKILILATGAEKNEIIRKLIRNPGTTLAGVALAGHPDVGIWTDQTGLLQAEGDL